MEMNSYLVNKIFTIPYLDKLIDADVAPDSFIKCIKRYESKNGITYGKAISKIYHYMDGSYRNEYYYKNTIFNKLLLEQHDLYTTAALTELPIANSKVDNFNRLASQIQDYYKVYCYVNIVVGYKNFEKTKKLLDGTPVGIYVLYDNGNLLCRKKARYNASELSYEAIFNILRKKEFEDIILRHFRKLPAVNDFQYYRECLKLIKKINIKTLQKETMEVLKKRTLLVVAEAFEESIPYELSFYVYFSKKNHEQYDKICDFLNKKVEV